ncbi:MAG: 50S ribosomal protein L4, partial [Dehalococcoidia bacterium]|nr:50S ribosomal protein L4 [Dehalococcoidia bacterium]
PHQRSYRQAMPKQMRRLAIRSALSSKVADEELVIVDGFQLSAPNTKRMVEIISNMKLGHSILIVTESSDENVVKSARNIPRVWTSPAAVLNVADILKYRRIVITEGAIRKVEELWGAKGPAQRVSLSLD